jgi:hypothetical protein
LKTVYELDDLINLSVCAESFFTKTTMAPLDLSVEQITAIRIQAAGFFPSARVSESTIQRRFKQTYGLLAISVRLVFINIQNDELAGEYTVSKPNILHLLTTLRWMKTYTTEVELAGIFKVHERTIRDRIWIYVFAMHALKTSTVSKNVIQFYFDICAILTSGPDCLEL